MVGEENIAADGDVGGGGGDVPILSEMLPRTVEGHRNGFLRLLALIAEMACTELPSSVVRFHCSSMLDHPAHWDF